MTTNIFQPNNHSVFKISWRPVASDLHASIKRDLLNFYGLTQVQEVSQVDEWEHNSNNFRITFQPPAGLKSVLLRKNIKIKNPDTLESIECLSAFLRERELPVPVIIRTRTHKLFYESGGYLWILSEFVAGDHFRGTEEELRESARLTARLHLALAVFQENLPGGEQISWTKTNFEKLLNDGKNREKEVDDFLLAKKRFLLDEGSSHLNKRQLIFRFSDQVIHNDLHPHNTIFSQGKLRALLDFGNMIRGPLVIDLAQALHRFGRQYVIYQNRPWSEVLPRAVEIFLSEYLLINQLPPEQIATMSIAMKEGLWRKICHDLQKRAAGVGAPAAEIKKLIILLEETKPLDQCLNQFLINSRK